MLHNDEQLKIKKLKGLNMTQLDSETQNSTLQTSSV